MQLRQSITQYITWFAGIVIIVIVIIFPLGYFFVSYRNMAGILETETEINAELITDMINTDPEMWEFQYLRIQEYLSHRPSQGYAEIRRVFNTKNELITETEDVLKKPLIMHSDELMDSGVVVGRIEIYRSLWPLLIRTGLAVLLLLPIGLGTYLILRNLPIRTLHQAEDALRRSEESAKQIAQENATMAVIGQIISSTLDLNEVYERFAEEVQKLIPFDRIVINTINIERASVANVYMAGKEIEGREIGESYPLEGSGIAEMVRTKSSQLIQTENVNEYKDRFPMLLSTFQAGFRSIMDVPLFSKGQIIGGLLLRSLKPYAYTDKEVRLAERVSTQIAGAIANAQLFVERKWAEEELRKNEKKLQALMDSSPIGICWADMQGNIEYNNRKFRDLFGYTVDDIPTIEEWRRRVYPDPAYRETVPSLVAAIAEAQKQGRDVTPIEVTITCKDGFTRSVSEVGTFASDRILAIFSDITEHKRAEESLQRSEGEARQLAQENAIMAEIGQIVSSTLNIEDVYERFAEKVHHLIPFDWCAITAINRKDNRG